MFKLFIIASFLLLEVSVEAAFKAKWHVKRSTDCPCSHIAIVQKALTDSEIARKVADGVWSYEAIDVEEFVCREEVPTQAAIITCNRSQDDIYYSYYFVDGISVRGNSCVLKNVRKSKDRFTCALYAKNNATKDEKAELWSATDELDPGFSAIPDDSVPV